MLYEIDFLQISKLHSILHYPETFRISSFFCKQEPEMAFSISRSPGLFVICSYSAVQKLKHTLYKKDLISGIKQKPEVGVSFWK